MCFIYCIRIRNKHINKFNLKRRYFLIQKNSNTINSREKEKR
ncbi:MAG: ApaG domain [Candidatus Marinimicrobia bacterium]|nr:ApaG domain [Candidatus Neomarinimicrobiota bacterium]